MSEQKHTPGPWRMVDDGTRCDGVWVQPSNANEAVICDIVGRVWDREAQCAQITDADVANAHLIAAAPELLEALKAARGYLLNAKIDIETGAKRATAIATIDGSLRVVSAAIAKADGTEKTGEGSEARSRKPKESPSGATALRAQGASPCKVCATNQECV